jgi:hypothetical protein
MKLSVAPPSDSNSAMDHAERLLLSRTTDERSLEIYGSFGKLDRSHDSQQIPRS